MRYASSASNTARSFSESPAGAGPLAYVLTAVAFFASVVPIALGLFQTFAAIYARAGRGKEARLEIQHLRRLDPELRLSHLGEWLPFQRGQDLEIFADALRKAGLPA